jgi:hypothetical protein
MTMWRYLLVLLAATAVFTPSALGARKSLTVSPRVAAPGGLVHVVGNATPCTQGSTVTAISGAFPGHAFGKGTLSGTVAAGGAFAFSGHLRPHLRRGRYSVTARCGGGTLGIVAYVTVR